MSECRLCGTRFNGSGDTAHYCNPVKSFKGVAKPAMAIDSMPGTITLSITEYEQLKKDAERFAKYRELVSRGDLCGTDEIDDFNAQFDQAMEAAKP